jgi:hypothetical protein
VEGFAYTVSETLRISLGRVDGLRQRILLALVPSREELDFRWQAIIGRVYYSEILAGGEIGREKISKLLSSTRVKRLSDPEQRALNIKRTFDYITSGWSVNFDPVTIETVREVAQRLSLAYEEHLVDQLFQSKNMTIRSTLGYLDSQREHSVVQAALIYLGMVKIFGSVGWEFGERIGRALAYLFLYKGGYDFRGMLVIEEYWQKNTQKLKEVYDHTLNTPTQTLWLEFFAETLVNQAEKIIENITSREDDKARTSQRLSSYLDLNDRQKEVLSLLDDPVAVITNRKVQKLFKVSQITASRDLARLAVLGLLFAHGKGRSVHYTRV